MSNQSRPGDGTAGYGSGHSNDNDNDTDAFSAQSTPDFPIMTTEGDWSRPPDGHCPPSTDFATGGAPGFVPEHPYTHPEGYGGPGPATWESIWALQSSPYSESWNPFTAAMHEYGHTPTYPAYIQDPGYPFGNPVSSSQHTGTSNYSTQCEVCNKILGTFRELQRHKRTVHSTAWYICKCTHSNARKDNYTRHLSSCKMKHKAGPSFFCICGMEHGNIEEHSTHVKGCAGRR